MYDRVPSRRADILPRAPHRVTEDITRAFCQTYHVPHLTLGKNEGRLTLKSFSLADDVPPGIAAATSNGDGSETPRYRRLEGLVSLDGKTPTQVTGRGNGALSAMCDALSSAFGIQASIREYSEHAITRPGIGAAGAPDARVKLTRSQAASYVELVDAGASEGEATGLPQKAKGFWGVGIDTDVTAAGLKAILSAASNLMQPQAIVEQAAAAVEAAAK